MFLEYLYTQQDNILDKYSSIERETGELRLRIKEIDKFLQMFEEAKTSAFVEFTPQVVKVSDLKKQEELITEKRELSHKLDGLEKKLSALSERKEELSKVIHDIKETISTLRKENLNDRKRITDKLAIIQQYIIQDPVRARAEIEVLIKSLEL